MTGPCTRWDAAASKHCGGTPTHLYNDGRRCAACSPSAMAGQPEASKGTCAPNRRYCQPDDQCTTCATPEAAHSREVGDV
jgi:hypothetical protein